MPISINLKTIKPEHVAPLLDFFEAKEKQGEKYWAKGDTYTFKDGTTFSFQNTVYQRHRKTGHNGVRYDVISNKKCLGWGNFGSVYIIKGTVALEEGTIRYKKKGINNKSRVVKILRRLESHLLWMAHNEYFFANQAGHLRIKPPTIIDDGYHHTALITMKRFSYLTLARILEDDCSKISLSLQQRLDLSKALLRAFKTQVSDVGAIHRDLKPENIFANVGDSASVYIFDYGFSRSKDTNDKVVCGTDEYTPYEGFFNVNEVTTKFDLYSIGRILALIWRVNLHYYSGGNHVHRSTDELLRSLFTGIESLEKDTQQQIRAVLKSLLDKVPANRCSIEKAIRDFDKITVSKPIENAMGVSNSALLNLSLFTEKNEAVAAPAVQESQGPEI